jgi:hypothetical protein
MIMNNSGLVLLDPSSHSGGAEVWAPTGPDLSRVIGSRQSERVERARTHNYTRERYLLNRYRLLCVNKARVERLGVLCEHGETATGKPVHQDVTSVLELESAWERVSSDDAPSAFHVKVFRKYVLGDVSRGRILKQFKITGDELDWVITGVLRELAAIIFA